MLFFEVSVDDKFDLVFVSFDGDMTFVSFPPGLAKSVSKGLSLHRSLYD